MEGIRTDLAAEAHELWRESTGETTALQGVTAREKTRGGVRVETVRILDERGEKALGKPRGSYITLSLDGEGDLKTGCALIASELRRLVPERGSVLVAGLGNRYITPDALGPLALRHVMVTRRPGGGESLGGLRAVAAIEAGVSGNTGLESAEMVRAAADRLRPAAVIAIDALASRRLERVCSAVQLADTGIIPGSGVSNSRSELSLATVGVPVIAVGVPTVVDAGTLAADIAGRAGVGERESAAMSRLGGGVIVTPKDIDRRVARLARMIGCAIDLALHEGFTAGELLSAEE